MPKNPNQKAEVFRQKTEKEKGDKEVSGMGLIGSTPEKPILIVSKNFRFGQSENCFKMATTSAYILFDFLYVIT